MTKEEILIKHIPNFGTIDQWRITIRKDFTDTFSPLLLIAMQEYADQECAEKDKEIERLKGLLENMSDGYHTFSELYEFRMVYNAALFNEWAMQSKYDVHKSWKHNDGELCFGGGWFIVVAVLPTGQISNHYEAIYWDLFQIQEAETAKYPFDGHTPIDVLNRLKQIQTTK